MSAHNAESERTPWRFRSRLGAYDASVSIGLNPLNWQCHLDRYAFGFFLKFGPLGLFVLWADRTQIDGYGAAE